MMVVIGVDPSTSPNLAVVSSVDGWIDFADQHKTAARQTKTKWRPVPELIAHTMAGWSVLLDVDHVAIEQIGAWTGQGLVSSAEFVGSMRLVEGVAAGLGIPIKYYTPAAWKRGMKLTGDKDQSRALASRLWPNRAAWLTQKQHHNRAEAALIAQFSIQKETRGG